MRMLYEIVLGRHCSARMSQNVQALRMSRPVRFLYPDRTPKGFPPRCLIYGFPKPPLQCANSDSCKQSRFTSHHLMCNLRVCLGDFRSYPKQPVLRSILEGLEAYFRYLSVWYMKSNHKYCYHGEKGHCI